MPGKAIPPPGMPAARPRRRWRRTAIAGAVLGMTLLALSAGAAHAARLTERSKQKQAAESERAALREKLAALKRDIDRTEAARSHAADALATSEAAISDANLSLRELAGEQKATAARLDALARDHASLQKTVADRQRRLSRMLRDQYVTGNEDRIKLLLSGDNPNRINRDLQYMGYASKAQAQLIEALRANLAEAERNRADARAAKEDLDEIAREEKEQKAVLEREKAKRAALLSQLSVRLVAQRREAGTIERDDKRLSGLVDRLARLIDEQRLAEAEERRVEARRRAEQAARAQAQVLAQRRDARTRQGGPDRQAAIVSGKDRDKDANKARSGLTQHNPDAIDADENPSKVPGRNELANGADVQSGVFPASFGALRGRLRLPLKGELLARYGGKRGDGPSWKGLFIRAPEGSEVRAVAGGQVVFAEWLRGFGNLIIIDHGGQYMTIYGNNQAVFKRAGDAVKTGEVIASAGNSGGNEQSGLYFEMRHQGRAFDPLGWVATR